MQIPHPVNFRFQKDWVQSLQVIPWNEWLTQVRWDLGSDVSREPWRRLAPLNESLYVKAVYRNQAESWTLDPDTLSWKDPQGRVAWRGDSQGWLGRCGEQWLVRLHADSSLRFHGLGEKAGSWEKSGIHTEFWNVDVWGKHGMEEIRHGFPDPLYVSIPWLILDHQQPGLDQVEREPPSSGVSGILIYHPGRVFMSLQPDMRLHECQPSIRGSSLYFGAPQGPLEFYVLGAPDLDTLVQRLHQLVGCLPLPPHWVWGHHQSRWGYQGHDHLLALDQQFRKHQFPCDGLWLDIDSMDQHRVFTHHPQHWPDPSETVDLLKTQGRKLIPILDPGVKDEEGFAVRESGCQADAFCRNPTGDFYRGFVWPGATLYPDFLSHKGFNWWKKQVRHWSRHGFAGFWLDMNDPATGGVSPHEMLFKGQYPHWMGHNVYANGMARATRAALKQTHTEPFLISRSGWIGIGAVAGVWLGDNISNWRHLRQSLPMALNMSMSGVPLLGADVPGFGDDCNPELMTRWYQAHCLFPLLRNHSVQNSIPQEPWVFGEPTLQRVRRAVRARYRLIPYLRQCFQEHQQSGMPVLRPLLAQWAVEEARQVEDQYLLGRHVMVAPVLQPDCLQRRVLLPPGDWWCEATQQVLHGGAWHDIPLDLDSLPLFFRQGVEIPVVDVVPLHSTEEIDWEHGIRPLRCEQDFCSL